MARRRLCSPAMLRNEVPRRVVAVAMLLSAAASAQQITLSQTPDRRLYSDASKQATYRSASKYPDWVNYADCASNVLLHFQLAVSSIPTNGSLQVWAGTDDCTKTEARTGDTTRTCWPVSSTLSNTQNVSVDVQSQHIVEYLGKTASDKPKTFADLSTTPSADVCTSTSNGATAVKLWFMFTDGSGNLLGTALSWPTSIDVVGPEAPTVVTPSAGDGAVNVSWTVSDAVSDVAEYVVYCKAQASSASDAGTTSSDAGTDSGTSVADASTTADAGETAADAGATATDAGSDSGTAIDAGTDAGSDAGTVSGTCVAPWSPEPSSPLSASFLTSINAYECGRVGGAARSSRVAGFSYGVAVAVAVAAVDTVENMGGIRAGGCATPVRTITFWDRYEDAGGDAGSCSFRAPAVSGNGLCVTALVGIAAALRLRRKGR